MWGRTWDGMPGPVSVMVNFRFWILDFGLEAGIAGREAKWGEGIG